MLSYREVEPESQNPDGSPMFPGVWVEVWVKDRVTGVSMLVAFRPKKEAVCLCNDYEGEACA